MDSISYSEYFSRYSRVPLLDAQDFHVLYNDIECALLVQADEVMDFLEGDLMTDMYETIAHSVLELNDEQRQKLHENFFMMMEVVAKPHERMLREQVRANRGDWELQDQVWENIAFSIRTQMKGVVTCLTTAAMRIQYPPIQESELNLGLV